MEALQPDIYVMLLMLSPLIAAVLSLLGKAFPRIHMPVFSFFVWAGGTIFALLKTNSVVFTLRPRFYPIGGWPDPIGIVLELNGISWIVSLFIVFIFSAIWFATYRQKIYGSAFYLVLYLTHFALQGILFSRDLFNLFVWFEVLSLCSIILVAYDRSPPALLAAFRYLMLSTISIVFYLLGLWIIYMYTGSLSFSEIGAFLQARSGENLKPFTIAMGLISAGLLTRSAIIPFHTWLPPAHSAAPYPVSALLSGLVIKIPLLALWHFMLYIPLFPLYQLFIWIGFGSALIGGAAALLQSDAKRILAYSSVGQIGFILSAMGGAAQLAGSAALFYILLHAVSKALLFLTIGYVTHAAGSRNVYLLRGLQRRFPFAALCFWIAAFTLIGVPFSGGYYAKLLVFTSLYNQAGAWMLTVAGGFTAAALFKLGRIFTGRPDSASPKKVHFEDKVAARPLLLNVSLTLLALICAVFTVFYEPLFEFLNPVTGISHIGAPIPDIDWHAEMNLLKAALISMAGGLGIFILHIKHIRTAARRIVTIGACGLNRAVFLLIAGILMFLLYAAIA